MENESGSTHFPNFGSSGTDLNLASQTMIIKAYPIDMVRATDEGSAENEEQYKMEPYVGLEFDSADGARDFYNLYAQKNGFKVRTGQLYRSRTDGSITSRRFVCSKEGFQLSSRTGCPAVMRVQKRDSGKWVVDLFLEDHNHNVESTEENPLPILREKTHKPAKMTVDFSHRPRINLLGKKEDENPCASGIAKAKRVKKEKDGRGAKIEPDARLAKSGDGRQAKIEPFAGLEFNSANDAYQFYNEYAAKTGFRIRIGQLFRSKNDGSITSRRFVCSKEGFQHPSRVGCGAFMRIKRHDFGRWVVDRMQKDHNHDLESHPEAHRENITSSKRYIEESNIGCGRKEIETVTNGYHVKQSRLNQIGSESYDVLLEYFQAKQGEDTGFFYAVEVHNSRCLSIFWADGHSRFLCSQFGDAIIFDTSYRKSDYLVPFACFLGVNHNKRPILLACALIADESVDSFAWLFKTWLKAMSGCNPLSIIADQDKAIQQAIARVFPRTRHRFSLWQIKAKVVENLGMMEDAFVYEYEKCVYQSQTPEEFDVGWNTLISKYGLKENVLLGELYKKRENWIPLFLQGTFFAGIPMNESMESFFGTTVTAQTPITEFISRYENCLEKRRQEDRKEGFNSFSMQGFLQTKEAVEEQCIRVYTHNVFKVFQKELLQCFSYLGFKIYEEGAISRYLVRKCGNENEKCVVTFISTGLSASCSCKMFEFEGVFCRHVLRVFQILGIREIPPHYILHRWTRDAEYGTLRDVNSVGGHEELKTVMLWSLRETANKFVEAGASSIEKHKLAYEIMREGGRKLCWQR